MELNDPVHNESVYNVHYSIIIPSIERLWLWWLLFSHCLASWTGYIGEYDSIRVVQCEARCSRYSPSEECMDICLAANYTKPGNCPDENSMSPFEAACLIACSTDSQCSDVAKCCKNSCGITCMRPTDLGERNGKQMRMRILAQIDSQLMSADTFRVCTPADLPLIPHSVEIRREKSNMVTVNWNLRLDLESRGIMEGDRIKYKQSVRYLVEERHVLGPRYLESRLSSWSVRQITNENHVSIRVGIKTGHWYQFRVAAVNEVGSRGYSTPSIPFKTAEPKSPREPRRLSMSGARIHADGKLRILIHWRQPLSDVPIMFYKLFWSRLIHGPTNDSILVYHQSVPKDKSCFQIKNLDIGFQYFFQVQAVSIYGGRRMVSRKASKVFNSTDYLQYDKRSGSCDKHDDGLRVRSFVCQCDKMIEARLVWPVDPYATGYNVSWRENLCHHTQEDRKSIHNFNSVSPLFQITQNTQLDIKRLQRNCTYSVKVRSIERGVERNHDYGNELKWNHDYLRSERNLGIEFITYGCEHHGIHDGSDSVGDFKIHMCRRRKARIKKLEKTFLLQHL